MRGDVDRWVMRVDGRRGLRGGSGAENWKLGKNATPAGGPAGYPSRKATWGPAGYAVRQHAPPAKTSRNFTTWAMSGKTPSLVKSMSLQVPVGQTPPPKTKNKSITPWRSGSAPSPLKSIESQHEGGSLQRAIENAGGAARGECAPGHHQRAVVRGHGGDEALHGGGDHPCVTRALPDRALLGAGIERREVREAVTHTQRAGGEPRWQALVAAHPRQAVPCGEAIARTAPRGIEPAGGDEQVVGDDHRGDPSVRHAQGRRPRRAIPAGEVAGAGAVRERERAARVDHALVSLQIAHRGDDARSGGEAAHRLPRRAVPTNDGGRRDLAAPSGVERARESPSDEDDRCVALMPSNSVSIIASESPDVAMSRTGKPGLGLPATPTHALVAASKRASPKPAA